MAGFIAREKIEKFACEKFLVRNKMREICLGRGGLPIAMICSIKNGQNWRLSVKTGDYGQKKFQVWNPEKCDDIT